jgi:hypothetical protein
MPQVTTETAALFRRSVQACRQNTYSASSVAVILGSIPSIVSFASILPGIPSTERERFRVALDRDSLRVSTKTLQPGPGGKELRHPWPIAGLSISQDLTGALSQNRAHKDRS